jgi:hypothetical protein
MWFRFPEGVGAISVEGQEFIPEVRDSAGRNYFRAPDHFAPKILGEQDFVAATPETDLPDLPQADPDRDSAIVLLQTQVSSLTMERDGLAAENASLKLQLEELQKEPAGVPDQPTEPPIEDTAKRK